MVGEAEREKKSFDLNVVTSPSPTSTNPLLSLDRRQTDTTMCAMIFMWRRIYMYIYIRTHYFTV